MTETAKLVMASPPSLVPSILERLNMQPAEVLGDVAPPSQHSGIDEDRLNEILAVARRESGAGDGPDVLGGLRELPDDATPEQVLDTIGRIARGELSPDSDTNAVLAAVAADDDRAGQVRAAAQARIADQIDAAATVGGELRIAGARERLVLHDRIALVAGEDDPAYVRATDDGLMVWDSPDGEVTLLYEVDGVAYPIGITPHTLSAQYRLENLPVLEPLEPLPDDATELQQEAWREKRDAQLTALSVASAASLDKMHSREAVERVFADTDVAERLRTGNAVADVDVELNAAAARHRRAQLQQEADEAALQARATALANGASASEADASAAAARASALGSTSARGIAIPAFGHDPVPASIEEAKYDSTTKGGIRPWGRETATDYEVIARRQGNLEAWGFTEHRDDEGYVLQGGVNRIKLSDYEELTQHAEVFVDVDLSRDQREALEEYTSGGYEPINDYFTGRDTAPDPYFKGLCSHITEAFAQTHNSALPGDPLQVVRGTRVPPAWGNDIDGFLDAAFKPGSRVEIGQVASFSTSASQASAFTGRPPYYIVANTRSGIPLRPLSAFPEEDEVALPPGHHMRCVHIDRVGFNGAPVIYLVDEEMVAEAEADLVAAR